MQQRIEQRNIAVCIILSLVTCGIYGIYWIYKLNDEINEVSGRNGTSGGMVILFSLITCGIYAIYWYYQMGAAIDELRARRNYPSSSCAILYLVLSLFGLSIVSLALMQNELNMVVSD